MAFSDKEGLKSNLRVVLGENADKTLVGKYTVEVFRNFAKYLVDFFRSSRYTEEYIEKNITLKGRENIDNCLSEGNGAIILAMHYGNWELGGAIIGGLKYPITAISLENKDKRIANLFFKQRAINGLRSIPLGMQIKEAFRTLERNELLAILGDKDYTSNGINVRFFGKEAVIPKGPAVFSLKTGAPIIVSAMTRCGDDSFELVFEKPIKPSRTGDYDKDIRVIMEQYLKLFEKYIYKNPNQWYAFTEIWNPNQTTQ